MGATEREEIQTMIDLAISQHHAENVSRLVKIEQRIIGIDGNGTGRMGALQRQDVKLEELSEAQKIIGSKVDFIGSKVDTILHRSSSWDKKTVWRGVRWMLTTIIALLALIVSYLVFRGATHPHEALLSTDHFEVSR